MMSGSDDKTAWADALERAQRHAPFLAGALAARSDLAALLAEGQAEAALAAAFAEPDDEAPVGILLRRQRQGLALVLAIGDLAGVFAFEAVARQLSDFADRALDRALGAIFAQRYGDPAVHGFAVIALGKHGGRELNYSSDIDPIFLYDPDILPTRPREDAADAAQRIARQLIELMSARDAHGYVFRVDMRLRPAAEVAPLAIPVEAAISHYESQALPWERAAFIRARAAAGDIALGGDFLTQIRPFVWRRSLDFGTIDEIAALTRQIRDHYHAGQRFGPGYDLKRGRGGIREVEFFAQAQQLIHGGRDPGLRAGATIDALGALAAAGHVGAAEAEALAEHYRLLRTIEHRLQMVDDQQTHSLPARGDALDGVARLDGLTDGEALLARLAPAVEAVATRYDALLAAQGGGQDDAGGGPQTGAEAAAEPLLSQDDDALADALAALGLADAPALARRIQGWREGKARALRSTGGRAAFEAILPALMRALAVAPDPPRAINRFGDLITNLPSTINIFRLLGARPGLLQVLVDILSHAPPLADALARRSDLLDGLIDASAFDLIAGTDALVARFAQEEPGDDYQARLDRVRVRVGEARFALGVQLIGAMHDPLAIAAGYARVAEAAIVRLADCAAAEFAEQHGRVPGSELVILGLGRLGGGLLTHASDLDLIFLFTGPFDARSDGPRPLGATHYYNRLAQRVIAALSVPTASGALYEVDTRLRPNGAQGLIAVSLESFFDYQRDQAWTWEHMALCRARPVYGSPEARRAVAAGIDAELGRGRDAARIDAARINAARINADVQAMRADMARHKPPLGPLDAKLLPGGLVDLEFIVHAAQLTSGAGLSPDLGIAIGQLARAGAVPTTLAANLADAHALLTRMLVMLRLVAPDGEVPPAPSRAVIARGCGLAGWEELLAAFADARQSVETAWRDRFGSAREAATNAPGPAGP